MVGPQRVYFLDEVTTGLDSATTHQVVSVLRDLAHLESVRASRSHVICSGAGILVALDRQSCGCSNRAHLECMRARFHPSYLRLLPRSVRLRCSLRSGTGRACVTAPSIHPRSLNDVLHVCLEGSSRATASCCQGIVIWKGIDAPRLCSPRVVCVPSAAQATVLAALQQPAPETYMLFDDVMLISEGVVLFHGPRVDALPFFERLGFACPPRKDPAGFLQEVTSARDQAVRIKSTP